MRNLEAIEKDLTAAREALSSVEGTPAEVYSRIVGYYRSVRNWNRGKREEYGERRLFRINAKRGLKAEPGSAPELSPAFDVLHAAAPSRPPVAVVSQPDQAEETRLLLFVRASCPGCPPAKTAAGKLGIPVDLVNADTADGMAEAVRRNVMSTPTAILLSRGGAELKRAGNAEAISCLLVNTVPVAI